MILTCQNQNFTYYSIRRMVSQQQSALELPPGGHRSLEGRHGSVAVPPPSASFWRQYRAFAGPALLVSVGYMDPGNWATDLEGGAQFRYGLMWVVALASLMAVVLPGIS